MKRSPAIVPDSPLITKPLFEAAMQCAKRLYLDFHESKARPAATPHQEELKELGLRLVELASQAFPKGLDLGEASLDDAFAKTKEFLDAGKPGVLFHPVFRGGGAEVRTDIVLVAGKGEMDIFEVKAGTTVKPRHLADIALQVLAIEASGYTVKSASLLHLDPGYVHDGTPDYPVQKLFKSVDVTPRARNQVERVRERLSSFVPLLDDESMRDLPTGTWCRNPLPCPYLPRCLADAPANPLVELPQLNASLERRMHEQGIESIDQIDPQQHPLNPLQRRAVRAVQEDRLIVEPFVLEELRDVDWPLAFIHVGWHLDALPRFAKSRPWQKAPFVWSAHRLEKSGRVYCRSHVSATADDPRATTLKTLADEIADAGTVFVFGRGHDERLRALLDDMTELKTELRSLLNASLLELGSLTFHGVYHPGFHGEFDLPTIYRVLSEALGAAPAEPIDGLLDASELEIATDADAEEAFRKILAKRTRSTTRSKLGKQLETYARHSSASLLRTYQLLAGSTSEQPKLDAEPES